MSDNGKAAATKQDLMDLESRLDNKLVDLESRLDGRLVDLEARLDNKLVQLESRIGGAIRESAQETETRLLRAFYGYTESTQKHFVDVDQTNGSLRDRLGALENRIIEIEKRLNFPPTN